MSGEVRYMNSIQTLISLMVWFCASSGSILALKVICADVVISSHAIITQMMLLLVRQHENLQEHDILI